MFGDADPILRDVTVVTLKRMSTDSDVRKWHNDLERQLDSVVRAALIHRGWTETEVQRLRIESYTTMPVAEMIVQPDQPDLQQERQMQMMITQEANSRVQKAEQHRVRGVSPEDSWLYL